MITVEELVAISKPHKCKNSPFILCGSGLEEMPELYRRVVGYVVGRAIKDIEAGKSLKPLIAFETENDGLHLFSPSKLWMTPENYPDGITFWCESLVSTDVYDKPCVSICVWEPISLAGETKVADCQIRLKEFGGSGQLTLDLPDFPC